MCMHSPVNYILLGGMSNDAALLGVGCCDLVACGHIELHMGCKLSRLGGATLEGL